RTRPHDLPPARRSDGLEAPGGDPPGLGHPLLLRTRPPRRRARLTPPAPACGGPCSGLSTRAVAAPRRGRPTLPAVNPERIAAAAVRRSPPADSVRTGLARRGSRRSCDPTACDLRSLEPAGSRPPPCRACRRPRPGPLGRGAAAAPQRGG